MTINQYLDSLRAEINTIGLQKAVEKREEAILNEIRTVTPDDSFICAQELLQEIGHLVMLADEMRKEQSQAWSTIKFSVLETAQNNAGEDGDKSVYDILTWVATMMDNLEERWSEE